MASPARLARHLHGIAPETSGLLLSAISSPFMSCRCDESYIEGNIARLRRAAVAAAVFTELEAAGSHDCSVLNTCLDAFADSYSGSLAFFEHNASGNPPLMLREAFCSALSRHICSMHAAEAPTASNARLLPATEAALLICRDHPPQLLLLMPAVQRLALTAAAIHQLQDDRAAHMLGFARLLDIATQHDPLLVALCKADALDPVVALLSNLTRWIEQDAEAGMMFTNTAEQAAQYKLADGAAHALLAVQRIWGLAHDTQKCQDLAGAIMSAAAIVLQFGLTATARMLVNADAPRHSSGRVLGTCHPLLIDAAALVSADTSPLIALCDKMQRASMRVLSAANDFAAAVLAAAQGEIRKGATAVAAGVVSAASVADVVLTASRGPATQQHTAAGPLLNIADQAQLIGRVLAVCSALLLTPRLDAAQPSALALGSRHFDCLETSVFGTALLLTGHAADTLEAALGPCRSSQHQADLVAAGGRLEAVRPVIRNLSDFLAMIQAYHSKLKTYNVLLDVVEFILRATYLLARAAEVTAQMDAPSQQLVEDMFHAAAHAMTIGGEGLPSETRKYAHPGGHDNLVTMVMPQQLTCMRIVCHICISPAR